MDEWSSSAWYAHGYDQWNGIYLSLHAIKLSCDVQSLQELCWISIILFHLSDQAAKMHFFYAHLRLQ